MGSKTILGRVQSKNQSERNLQPLQVRASSRNRFASNSQLLQMENSRKAKSLKTSNNPSKPHIAQVNSRFLNLLAPTSHLKAEFKNKFLKTSQPAKKVLNKSTNKSSKTTKTLSKTPDPPSKKVSTLKIKKMFSPKVSEKKPMLSNPSNSLKKSCNTTNPILTLKIKTNSKPTINTLKNSNNKRTKSKERKQTSVSCSIKRPSLMRFLRRTKICFTNLKFKWTNSLLTRTFNQNSEDSLRSLTLGKMILKTLLIPCKIKYWLTSWDTSAQSKNLLGILKIFRNLELNTTKS